ncbi:MAG: hypothetical protein IJX52_04935 [Oscillibacter sp.]|nr:hypothetical protein [Oscillibacter sp.]
MKKALSVFAVLATFVLIVFAAVSLGGQSSSKGIVKIGEVTCYRIKLDGSKPMGKVFSKMSPQGQVATAKSGSFYVNVLKYSKISQGGWIAYDGDMVLYVQEPGTESTAKSACGMVSPNSDNYLTLEEAAEYLPWLS